MRNNDKALELITTGIMYYCIEGVLFQKTMKEIEQGEPVKRRTDNPRSEQYELF
ncbi:hypothetical protein D3C80_1911270 [compost metagenome]